MSACIWNFHQIKRKRNDNIIGVDKKLGSPKKDKRSRRTIFHLERFPVKRKKLMFKALVLSILWSLEVKI